MSDLEYNYDSDQEVSKNHSQLINAVRQLDKGQRVRKPERSEPSLEVSEFHLVKSGITNQDAIEIGDLAKTLGKKGDLKNLSKKINSTKIKSKVLRKPLEKPAAERIKRVIGFKNTKTELTKWTGIVARNRTASSISFPLSQCSMKLEPTNKYLNRFRLQSDLEKKLVELEPEKELEEENNEFPLTLQEMLERRKEAAKLRAQQSYKVAKAHRQNKIKSKKFHRIQRKERIKKSLKEFEELQKTDPQAALEKLDQLDKIRAEERMTLRHKSTGQWAKSKQVRAKYDKESRQVLAEQLSISRDLTQKIKRDDSDEDDNEDQPFNLSSTDKENPWLNPVKSQSEVNEFISRYRKYYDEQKVDENKNKITKNNSNEDKNVNKINEIHKEPEHEELLKSKNPVEKVFEEYLPKQNGFNEHNNTNESDSENNTHITNMKQQKKFQKTSNCKRDTTLNKSKIIKEKVGTSSWFISSVESKIKNVSNNKDIDIDEMFDCMEDKIQEKVTKKLNSMKRMLDKETKNANRKKIKRKNNDSENDIDKLGLKGQKNVKPLIDKPIEESTDFQPSNQNLESEKTTNITEFNRNVSSQVKTAEIDPNKFMNVKPVYVKTLLPNEIAGEEDALDDDELEDQHQIISEAFADDDVVGEFQKAKEEEIKKDQLENVNLQLPGWGSWGGKNIKPSARKKRRFIIKMPKAAPRRDENKGDVVIIEEQCPKIKKHLVNELPFPFTSVQDFEASIRAPLGRDFVPEKTFSKLINPAVKTKMGKVIEPMSEDMLINTKNIKKLKKQLQTVKKKPGQQKGQTKQNGQHSNAIKAPKSNKKKGQSNGKVNKSEQNGAKKNVKEVSQNKTVVTNV